MISWIGYVTVGLILVQMLVAIVRVKFFWKNHRHKISKELPYVSVLTAARNEEIDLPKLLRSFEQLDYPADRIQFLFADDQSSDRTSAILETWCNRACNRTFITISPKQTAVYNENGKANALAILEEGATGDYYFFTDADCEMNPNWIREGVSCFGEKVGIVLGITQVKATSMLEKFQEIDWWLTLGFVKIATDLSVPTTGLGNNMVISKEAYKQSGGFKNLPFCLTEDLEISKAIQREGYKIAHQVSEGMLAMTKPESSYSNLLQQRKRWMNGVMTLPFYWKLVLALQVIYFAAVLLIIYLNPFLGLGLAWIKICLQGIFLTMIVRKSGARISWIYLLLFDFYNFNTTLLTILYYFWPSKTKWKSRTYP
jgi:cellulose synthase/poly-beta-1,6-N-acetylglucosamine synthase-like glycosyltransferase